MSKYGTGWIETEAILAAQQEDEEEVERLLASMARWQLYELREAAAFLEEMCGAYLEQKQ